jgi:outer membrane murein-binding lipoprotein Lpp
MLQLTHRVARAPLVAALVLGGLGLSACATKGYVNEQIATVNTRIDAVDRKASDALARADAAGAAANGSATDARTANQRLDQLTARVDALEARPVRRPRN